MKCLYCQGTLVRQETHYLSKSSGEMREPAALRAPLMSARGDATVSRRELRKVLRDLRGELARSLGDQLVSVFLYGSQARSQARPDSDIDVLVVVRDDSDYGDLIRRTSAAVSALSLRYDVVISRAFVSQQRYEREQSPFLLNVRREGVSI